MTATGGARVRLDEFEGLPSRSSTSSLVTAQAFAAVFEPGVDALVGTPDEALVPIGGDAMIYGDGGTGKTTLAIDLAFHVAAGVEWLEMPIARPARVLLIESEGPRPLFRAKLRRKLEAWQGELGDRLYVWEHPWAGYRFTDEEARVELAGRILELELDLVIAGPLTRLGMDEAGTLQDVRDFARLVDDVRARSLLPVAFLLVHHENKGGRVSGAWEGAGDTLLHVQGQGHGRTRLFVQKARWSSSLHARTLHLRWAEAGDTFEVEDAPPPDVRITEALEQYVLENAGCTWTAARDAIEGGDKTKGLRRDALLEQGVLVNVSETPGRFVLWHRDDPARPHKLDEGDAELEPESLAERARRDADENRATERTDSRTDNRASGRTERARIPSDTARRDHDDDRAAVRPLKGARSSTHGTPTETEEDDEW